MCFNFYVNVCPGRLAYLDKQVGKSTWTDNKWLRVSKAQHLAGNRRANWPPLAQHNEVSLSCVAPLQLVPLCCATSCQLLENSRTLLSVVREGSTWPPVVRYGAKPRPEFAARGERFFFNSFCYMQLVRY